MSKEGHNESHIIDARREDAKLFWMIQRIRDKCNCRRTTLEHIGDTTGSLAAFGSIGSVIMMTWKRSNGRKKQMAQPRKVNDTKEDIPTQHEVESIIFKGELLTQVIRFPIFPPPFLAGTPIIF